MSHPWFCDLPSAVAMYLAGQCRRWAIVDGHLVDLHQAAHPVAVQREDLEPERAEVLPEVAVPAVPAEATAVECCRACGRPMIGEVAP